VRARLSLIATLGILGAGCLGTPARIRPGDARVEAFRADLLPYGHWVDHPKYGTVWEPHGAFAPYQDGMWAYDRIQGIVWVSNEPFGWAVEHYGRWARDASLGWIWVPDRTWGPAWVEWRTADNQVGWAALRPEGGGARDEEAWRFVAVHSLLAPNLPRIWSHGRTFLGRSWVVPGHLTAEWLSARGVTVIPDEVEFRRL